MTKRADDESEATGLLGAYAIGGAGLAGARILGGLLSEGDGRSRELGPAPIGSDPWLRAEVGAAFARESGADASEVIVEVREAIVTLRGHASASDAARLERAARTVPGIKGLQMEIAAG